MTALTEVFVTVRPDTEKFGPEVKKKLAKIDAKKEGEGVAARWGVGFNGAFGGIISKSAGLFAGAFAVVQGAKVFGGFIKEAAESEKISRITANAIRATGGAAKITAGEVSALATSISNKTAIDDEQVQTAANMLLTFKNIRNETGKNNDIFNRATQAAADLSIQFGGMDGASKQLGKALNDPIKGTTALAKAGVTFTDQQKKQIKTLVESGNVLGAQKIILAEIEGQVGGAAAAAADPLERLKVVAGNLGEEVGGFLLPAANKFAGFATGTLIPGVRALFSAFQEGDVTSDGFVGGMERIGVAARGAFDFFKSEVLPRLREFGSFVTGTAAPAVATFGSNIATTLGPAVKDVFGFVKAEVLPRLRDFGTFLGESVLPKVGELASALSKNKDFLVPFAATIATIIAAVKTWAIVQGILNVVLAANPIGLIVVALAALVGGLVWAYRNSETFKKVVDTAFKVVRAAAVFMWDNYLKPMFTTFVAVLKGVWETAQTWGTNLVTAWNSIKEPARAALAFVVRKFLDFVGSLLTGAEKAFGWVPGVGEKLRGAATEFNKFKTNVNKALDGINDEPVDIKVGLAYTQALGQATKKMKFADGGGVFGGTRGKDSVPALLMPDEHVWTTREVAAAGGHGAMKRLRQAALAGELDGYANGGVVVNPKLPSNRRIQSLANTAAGAVEHTSSVMAKAIAKELVGGPGGPPGARKSFRGVTLNQRTISMLLNAERLLGAAFHITQGSYSTRVAASGSTHAGGGAMDTNGPRGWGRAVAALRAAGFAAWHRTPSQGPWNHHIHSIALGDTSASPAAKRQMASFRRGGNGLGGMAKGGPVLFDGGGWLPMGRSLVENRTGKPEPLARADLPMELSDRSIERLADAIAKRPTMLDGRRVDDMFARRALNY